MAVMALRPFGITRVSTCCALGFFVLPMILFWIVVLVSWPRCESSRIPFPLFEEMTLPSLGCRPPIRVRAEFPTTAIPEPRFPVILPFGSNSAFPEVSVPIRFAVIIVPLLLFTRIPATPSLRRSCRLGSIPLPEITLLVIVVEMAFPSEIPLLPFPSMLLPAVIPIKLPVIVVKSPPLSCKPLVRLPTTVLASTCVLFAFTTDTPIPLVVLAGRFEIAVPSGA